MMFHAAALVVVLLIKPSSTQDANCDFRSDVEYGKSYYVYSPRYPSSYPPGVQCRWIAQCGTGYNCRLDCPTIDLPYTKGCTLDRLLISKSGDPQLLKADQYCGKGSLTAVSTGNSLSIGLIVPKNTTGGAFQCQLTSQPASSATCSCGYKKTNRIVGGEVTKVNEFPMMAGLVDREMGQIKCGAVTISNKHVLTAAHCIVGANIDNHFVLLGEHDVSTGEDTKATQAYKIDSWISHPSYSASNYDYDIAIVKVSGTITFNEQVGPACLPFKFTDFDFTGSYVTALGWGTLGPGEPVSNQLRKVDLQVISQAKCKEALGDVTARQICTFTKGKDACQFDSGGPELYTDPSTGLLHIVAIISSGRYCASPYPGINTRVNALLDWIVRTAPYDYCIK